MIKVIIKEKKHKEHFIGGAADNIPYSKFNQKDLEKGKEKEMRDHGMPPSVAKEIAADEIAKNSPNLNEEEQTTLVRDLMAKFNKYDNSLWVFYDTETTGFDTTTRQLTQIAAKVERINSEEPPKEEDKFETHVRLSDDTLKAVEDEKRKKDAGISLGLKKGELSITDVIKMTQYDISKSEGYPSEKEAISNFYNFLNSLSTKYPDKNVILVGHNIIKFDNDFVNQRAKLYSLPPLKHDAVDTLHLMNDVYYPLLIILDKQGILPKIKTSFGDHSFTLKNITDALEIENKEHHTAINDVKMLITATKKILNYIKQHSDVDVTAAAGRIRDIKTAAKALRTAAASKKIATEAAKKKAPIVKPSGPPVQKTKNIWLLSAPPAAGKSTWFRSVFNVDPNNLQKQYGLLTNDLGFISEDAILDSDTFQKETKQEFIDLLVKGNTKSKFKDVDGYQKYLEDFLSKARQQFAELNIKINDFINSPEISNNVTSVDIYSKEHAEPKTEEEKIKSLIRHKRTAHAMKRFHAEAAFMIKEVTAAKPKNIVVDRLHATQKTRATSLKIISDLPEYKVYFVSKQVPQDSEEKEKFIQSLVQRDIQRSVASKGARLPMPRSRIEDVIGKLSQEPASPQEAEGSEVISLDDVNTAKKIAGTESQSLKEYNYDDYLEWLNNSQLQKDLESKTFLTEKKLSPYWKVRVERRAAKAGRPVRNPIDRKWGEEQQIKSERIDQTLLKLFEKELGVSSELAEEASKMMRQVKHQRKKMQEKKRDGYPQDKRFGPGKKAAQGKVISTERTPVTKKGVSGGFKHNVDKMKKKHPQSVGYAPGAAAPGGIGEGKNENK